MMAGISVLALLQIIYTLRINWRKEAYKVKIQFLNKYKKLKLSNFKALEREQVEEHKDDDDFNEQTIGLNNNEIKVQDENYKKNNGNLRVLLCKRIALCSLLLFGSCAFIFTRDLIAISESGLSSDFNISNLTNETFLY